MSTFAGGERRRLIATLIVASLLLSSTVPVAGQGRITSPCADILTGGPGYPKSFVFPPTAVLDSTGRAAVDREVGSTVAVLSFVPQTSAEYRRVYDRQPTAAIASELRRNRVLATGIQGARLHSEVGDATIAATIAALKENVVVFVGHNDNGSFRFLDGSTESVTHLAELAAKVGKLPVIISCRAAQHVGADGVGTKTVLTSAAGLMVAQQLSRALRTRSTNPVSVATLGELTQSLENDVQQKLRVNYIVLRGCHIGGLIVAALLICMAVDDEIC